MTELVELIGDVAGRPARGRAHRRRVGGDLVGDNTRMRETLGVAPQVSLREGLGRTVGSRLPTA